MSLTHTWTLQVRYHECDAYGHVNHANYLRYMQEAAFDASAAVGYTVERYQNEGLIWLAHETDIEYLQSLHYGDLVDVKTWVGSDELIARAQTDWVLLNAQTLTPTSIPKEMVTAYLGEGDIDENATLPKKRIVPPPLPPPGAFVMHKRVEWRDIDSAQHLNNAAYLNYIEDCAIQAAASRDWPMSRMREGGFGFVARQHHLEYKAPALLDDELELTTWLSDVKTSTAVRHYTIKRASDGLLLAQAQTLWVWLDPGGFRR
jgi:acyl-CoA thioester hydrolase